MVWCLVKHRDNLTLPYLHPILRNRGLPGCDARNIVLPCSNICYFTMLYKLRQYLWLRKNMKSDVMFNNKYKMPQFWLAAHWPCNHSVGCLALHGKCLCDWASSFDTVSEGSPCCERSRPHTKSMQQDCDLEAHSRQSLVSATIDLGTLVAFTAQYRVPVLRSVHEWPLHNTETPCSVLFTSGRCTILSPPAPCCSRVATSQYRVPVLRAVHVWPLHHTESPCSVLFTSGHRTVLSPRAPCCSH
jgi:hypothetical protein